MKRISSSIPTLRDGAFKLLNIDTASRTVIVVLSAESLDASRPAGIAQLMRHLPVKMFHRCLAHYAGEHKVKSFWCLKISIYAFPSSVVVFAMSVIVDGTRK